MGTRRGQVPAGWNSSTTLPEGSSSRTCEPPGPVTMSLRKRHAGFAEPGDLGGDVGDEEVDAVPAAGPRLGPVGHGPPGRAGRPAEQQPQVAAGDVGEGGRGAGAHLEAEVLGVEADGGVHVVDHVADVHHLVRFRHGSSCAVVRTGLSGRRGRRAETRCGSPARRPSAGRPGSSPRRRRPRARRRGRGCSSGSVSGWPGNSGHTSRTRSHRLITRSKRCWANTPQVLRPLSGQVDAVLVAHHPHGVGVQGLGVAAGAVRLDQPTGADPGQRLGHLGTGAVARAQEQHPRRHRPGRAPLGGRRREPEPGVQGPTGGGAARPGG